MTDKDTAATAITPQQMLARVIYRDDLMLVIDKPAGLPVHRGPNGGSSVEDHFDALRHGLPRAPALAHRLDKNTSGCLVLGRHRKALAHLGSLFRRGKVGKTYWAIVEGGPEANEGCIAIALGRLDPSRGWWMKPDPKGLPAVTTWKVLGRSDPSDPGEDAPQSLANKVTSASSATAPGQGRLAWLALEPLTGRTHQLRVHCATMGWPIVGDDIYGSAPRHGGPILQLHARDVVIPVAKERDPVRVTAPVPEHMRQRLAMCGWIAEAD